MKGKKLCKEICLTQEEETSLLEDLANSDNKSPLLCTVHDYYVGVGVNPNDSKRYKDLLKNTDDYGVVLAQKQIPKKLICIAKEKLEKIKSLAMEEHVYASNCHLPLAIQVHSWIHDNVVKLCSRIDGKLMDPVGVIEKDYRDRLRKTPDQIINVLYKNRAIFADVILEQYCVMMHSFEISKNKS